MEPTSSQNISGILVLSLAAMIPFYSSMWEVISLPEGDIPLSNTIVIRHRVCQQEQ